MDHTPSKNWELTLYEMNRKPQDPITDGTEIAVSPRSLKSELMCPICLDILKVTMTTKECLHRFCAECIVTALRSGNKECPTCRKKLVSKRSLRKDPNFDALIAKIYPSREEYEAHQDKLLAKLNPQHLTQVLTRSLEQQLGLTENGTATSHHSSNGTSSSTPRNVVNGQSRSNNNNRHHPHQQPISSTAIDSDTDNTSSSTLDAASSSSNSAVTANVSTTMARSSHQICPELELLLKPHPSTIANNGIASSLSDHGSQTIKYLKAPVIATDSSPGFSLYWFNETANSYARLGSRLSVGDIGRDHFPGAHCLTLYYSRGGGGGDAVKQNDSSS